MCILLKNFGGCRDLFLLIFLSHFEEEHLGIAAAHINRSPVANTNLDDGIARTDAMLLSDAKRDILIVIELRVASLLDSEWVCHVCILQKCG